MPNPMIRVHDLSTDTVIDREMTEEEYAEYTRVQEQPPVE